MREDEDFFTGCLIGHHRLREMIAPRRLEIQAPKSKMKVKSSVIRILREAGLRE
jgi:hypothetical protein